MADKDEAAFFIAEGGYTTGVHHDVPEMRVVESQQSADQHFYHDAVCDQGDCTLLFSNKLLYYQHRAALHII